MKHQILQKNYYTPTNRPAFTLIEILLVMGILGLLAGLVIINAGAIFGGNQKDVASLFVRQSISTPLQAYSFNMGSYPTTDQGIQALLNSPDSSGNKWRGPYIKEMPLDPWKRPYGYRYPGTHNPSNYDVWSNGPDGISGNADDIGNW